MTRFHVKHDECIQNVNLNDDAGYIDLEKVSLSKFSITSKSKQTIENSSEIKEHGHNKNSAKKYVVSLVTVFYLTILVIYAVVLELSSWLIDKKDKEGLQQIGINSLVFNLYIYILSFMYFIYCYIMCFKKKCSKNVHENSKILPTVGSLYIRLGAVVFAIVSCIYYIFSIHTGTSVVLDICAIIFTVIQTHLLFYSSTMFENKHFIISCFGTMHLVAANLITWFQFLFAKNRSTQKTIEKNSKKNKPMSYLSIMTTTLSSLNSAEEMGDKFNDAVEVMEHSGSEYEDCQGVECIFGSFTKIFYTAAVEYSLIAAAVMFIVWHNLGKAHKSKVNTPKEKKKKDCKMWLKQIFGICVGSAFSIGTMISMVLFYVYCYKNEHYISAEIYNITEIVLNSIGIPACIFAIWRMRSLKYVNHESDESHANQELLDIILLAIGLIGELAFSIAGLMGIYSVHEWHSLSVILTVSHIIQIIQAVFQCFVICFASKLRTLDSNEQPGKQSITFLIILNIAMFIYNLFISDKAGTYESIISFYGEQNWVFLVRIFSPLTIFFRFHSSVCFVEIWQHTYSSKH